MVVIIDDREDVWNFAPNLIHVRPYHFFQHTGDINAPPGLAKQEKDDKEGYDFTSMNSGEKQSEASPPETSNGSTFKGHKGEEDKTLPEPALTDVNGDSGTQIEEKEENKFDQCVAEDSSQVNAKEEIVPKTTSDDETKEIEVNRTELIVKKEHPKPEDGKQQNVSTVTIEKKTEEKPSNEKQRDEESSKIHIHDTDDYLLHLQDILRTIHHAYYELYDDNRKMGDETKAVPDMKIVLPYVRRKVLEKVHIVFSGVVPTNTPLEKSKPYLVAKSLGAVIMDRVSETTTHVIAARLGTAKVRQLQQNLKIHSKNFCFLQ